jgi:hypothetical protein
MDWDIALHDVVRGRAEAGTELLRECGYAAPKCLQAGELALWPFISGPMTAQATLKCMAGCP